ncbi:DUF551 domain-containing protein [Raoultella ornithinolytica]|uniref:DUF551 domain-containing protein n=1 Tax=Raoultella ornithinolytica TaxID=54291 RepID=UPI00292ADC24|nr:DUF551 domain-containing protein [Raoultella ornithinolytica]MDV0591952.1 DUF551 domain-containing protein [Raoultella ornithinolytica]
MTKSTITRERLQQIIRVIDGEAYDEEEIREWLSSDEIMELSRMALAAMDSEPVGKPFMYGIADPDGNAYIDEFCVSEDLGLVEDTVNELNYDREEGDELNYSVVALYRHAQPAPVVPEEKPMPNPLSMYAVDAVAAIAEAKGWNACRAAMLQGKAEPVSLHPELSVWYGSMPESNGKINWTAILHRKGECLSTGITIELSEYPERVRYEADRVRHIIGELKEEPDILAYDADEHSGYVKPGNSPVIPDGYRLQPISEYEAMCATVNSDEWPQRWIPVSERMPEDRTQVILWDAEIGEVTSGHYSHKTHTFYHCGDAIQNEITHWMPLPAAPQEVK